MSNISAEAAHEALALLNNQTLLDILYATGERIKAQWTRETNPAVREQLWHQYHGATNLLQEMKATVDAYSLDEMRRMRRKDDNG